MINKIWEINERFANNVDKKFHQFRRPVITPLCKFFIILHMNQSHVTAIRFIMLLAFLPIWISEHYGLASLLLAINIILDIADGDLARILKNDSDVRKFEDVMVDNIMVVILPLALIWQQLISGFLGSYYIFIVTLSWWLSVVNRNSVVRSKWLFRAQASPFLFITRFCVVTILIFLYGLFEIDIFTQAIIVLSIILTLNAVFDYYHIIRLKQKV